MSKQNVSVDETDVEDVPEQVFPSTPASSPNTIVGSHLVEPIHSSHVAVVASDTDGRKQVDDLSVATCCSHGVVPGVIGGNHANVTLVTPLAKHDTFGFVQEEEQEQEQELY